MPFDPGAALLVAFTEFLYLRALRVLRRRGVEVPALQIALWHGGIALWVVGFFSPIHTWGDDLLSAHMAQHLLIADLAAPLLLAGARHPGLMFLLPKDILIPRAGGPALGRAFRRGRIFVLRRGVRVPLPGRRGVRRAFRWLREPLVAIPIYVLVLYGWHFS